MAEKLRYTGCWPPVEILDKYANWMFASDEETEPDQDETTLKPEDQQAFVSESTDCTAASIRFANGEVAPAMLSIMNGKIETIDVWDGEDWWCVRGNHRQVEWTPVVEDWLPADQRRPVAPVTDSSLFPAVVVSRLPTSDDSPIRVTIPLSGTTLSSKPWYRFWQR